jgi:membrane protein YdbS with pleckstrin-like domain
VTGEPRRRLAPSARWAWRAEQAFTWTLVLVAVLIASASLDFSALFALLPLAGLTLGVTVVPELRWRRWRWDVRPDAIEIRHGMLTVRHTLVPMLRVQHVETTSDIVEQQLDLANVVVHTAAGSHKIPLLTLGDAAELRDRIAALAETADGT